MKPAAYHLLGVQQKQAQFERQLGALSEPTVACPSCDTKTTPSDLLRHVDRCTGPTEPGKTSVWVTWRQAIDRGVPRESLKLWARSGKVRVRGARGDRQYLLRDAALMTANLRLRRR